MMYCHTIVVGLCLLLASPATQATEMQHRANPIRKVVTMLQAMQAKIRKEGDAEKELFDNFMCYCKTNTAALKDSMASSDAKLSALTSDIEAAASQKEQVEGALAKAQADRVQAVASKKEATAIREKDAADFAKDSASSKANIAAVDAAIDALEKGTSPAFLQQHAASALQKVLLTQRDDFSDDDRQTLLAFLSGDAAYVPQSGEVIGILKQLGDQMRDHLKEAVADEEAAVATFEALVGAKSKEVQALGAAIETGLTRKGELGVSIAQMQHDKQDTTEALESDTKFFASLRTNCDTRANAWEQTTKTRQEEELALAQTIKMLNSDDALDIFKTAFKKTNAGASSFIQMTVSSSEVKARALSMVHAARRSMNAGGRQRLDLVLLALRGKQAGFEKVVGMIDDMIGTLKTEQESDATKKDYCGNKFDEADDRKKALSRTLGDLDTQRADTQESISAVTRDVEALQKGIKDLDQSVTEATEQRKNEHSDFAELLAENAAAKELLKFAKNRLYKFYNTALYKPPPEKQLSESDRIFQNFGGEVSFVQVTAHARRSLDLDAAPATPEAQDYTMKSQEAQGVIAMLDLLVKDLDKETTQATTGEKDAQADYEQMMGDSAEMRVEHKKSLIGRSAALAELEADLQAQKDDTTEVTQQLSTVVATTKALHLECDWLVQNFDVRKEARAGEIDALNRAKAVLSGADYEFLQLAASRRSLRRK